MLRPEITEPITVTTVDFGNGMIGASGPFYVAEDVTNYVIFDGVEYTCEPYYEEAGGGTAIGSLSFSDYPFLIADGVILTQTPGEHTVLQYREGYAIHADYLPCLSIYAGMTEDRTPYLTMEDVEKIRTAFAAGVPVRITSNYGSAGIYMNVLHVSESFIFAFAVDLLPYNLMDFIIYQFSVRNGTLDQSGVSRLGSVVQDGNFYPVMRIGGGTYKINVVNGNLTATLLTT